MSWAECVSLNRLRMRGEGDLLEEGRRGGGGGGHSEGWVRGIMTLERMIADQLRSLKSYVYNR